MIESEAKLQKLPATSRAVCNNVSLTLIAHDFLDTSPWRERPKKAWFPLGLDAREPGALSGRAVNGRDPFCASRWREINGHLLVAIRRDTRRGRRDPGAESDPVRVCVVCVCVLCVGVFGVGRATLPAIGSGQSRFPFVALLLYCSARFRQLGPFHATAIGWKSRVSGLQNQVRALTRTQNAQCPSCPHSPDPQRTSQRSAAVPGPSQQI